jgi:hypothetical protein
MSGDAKAQDRGARALLNKLGAPEGDRWTKVIRPLDLLYFEISWSGLEIEPGDPPLGGNDPDAESPVLVAGRNGGVLRVRWPFQHVAEVASPVDDNGVPFGPLPATPVAARAAHKSRLVFHVPPGHRIDYSVEGLLEAMATLELVVAPVAKPAPSPKPWFLFEEVGYTALFKTQLAKEAGLHGGAGGAPKASAIDLIRTTRVARRFAETGMLGRAGPIERQIDAGLHLPKIDPVRMPRSDETAIEAPFRLILSPSTLGTWAHAAAPVTAPLDPKRVELWHTRLAVRRDDGPPDEVNPRQRIVRAIWARDRERKDPVEAPFKQSLNTIQRKQIVQQTSGAPGLTDGMLAPVNANRLALTALGAYLDLKAHWPYKIYPEDFFPLASWEHIAPLGRDQWVRVVEPLASYPPGHDAFLVTITYRAILEPTNPQARTFQYQRVVLGDPYRDYDNSDLPFLAIRLGPKASPNLNDPGYWNPPARLFIPTPLGSTKPFLWNLDGLDKDGKPCKLQGALVFYSVPAGPALRAAAEQLYRTAVFDGVPINTIPAHGQVIAYAPNAGEGQGGGTAASTASETVSLTLDGTAGSTSATPRMAQASIIPAAARRMSPNPVPIDVRYPAIYLSNGLGGANKGQVYLESIATKALELGTSEHSGGFVRPDVQIGGLARSTGIVGDIAKAAAGSFDAKTLLQGLGGAKLFGLVDLVDLVPDGLLDQAPKFLTEDLDQLTAFLRDAAALRALSQETALPDAGGIKAAADAIEAAVATLFTNPLDAAAQAALDGGIDDLLAKAKTLNDALATLALTPRARSDLGRVLGGLAGLKKADLLGAVGAAIKGIDPGNLQYRARLEWRTGLKSWGLSPGKDIFVAKSPAGTPTELVISVETRATAKAAPKVDVAAEITAFQFLLLPDFELMRVKFDRLAFRASAGRKPEVDVVFGGLEFLGILGFVETLSSLIPLDGFSDPPFVEVSPQGARAGFTVALPNLAIGIFSLANISLGADAKIPFLGDVVSVGFNFCTRERPFTLSVAFLGGGGFFGIRIGPKGLILLEAAFEFGAYLAVDFGVASGSISAMAGIYFKLEADAGSLTGYFRLRGEVDVLSLISASIELYMGLTYAFDTGKVTGEASITVHVEVLFLSTSVSIHASRTFAGSNGDPTTRQMLAPPGRPIDEIWIAYCGAFAAEGA